MNNKTVKWLFSVLGSRKYYIVILTIIHALHGASGVLYALLLRQIVDSAVDHDSTGFWKGILYVVLLVTCQLILRALIRWLTELAKASFLRRTGYNWTK